MSPLFCVRWLTLCLGLAVANTACVGPLVDEIEFDQSSAESLRREIAVYDSDQLQSINYQVIGPVQATSCFNNFITDKPASREAAVDQMRLRARQHGANALGNVVCEPMRGTDLATNCWSSVTCYASAIRAHVEQASSAEVRSGTTVSSGSGFFVSPHGDAVTNAHVVERCDRIVGRIGATRLEFELLALDRRNDIALLRARAAAPFYARLGVRALQRGDTIIAVGYPLHGLLSTEPKIKTGVVSALAGPGNDTSIFQMSAALQPGNSGGPLINQRGRVVGIAVGKLDAIRVAALTGDVPTDINFGIKTEVLRIFLESNSVPFHAEDSLDQAQSVPSVARSAENFTFQVFCARGAG